MFILNRIITTRIDRGFCFDTAKLYVYDFRNMYSPSYSYYVSPFPIEFNYIKHMSEDAQDMIIDRVLDAYVINGLGKYASNLDEIKKMITDNEEVITDFISKMLFDSCVRTGYITKVEDAKLSAITA